MNASLQALVACPPFYNLLKSIPTHHVAALRAKASTPTIDAMIDLVNEFAPLPAGSRLTPAGPQRKSQGAQYGGNNSSNSKKEDPAYDLTCDPPFEPTTIHKLWNSSRSEHEGRQEDAEEFLSYLLNKLNDEMLEVNEQRSVNEQRLKKILCFMLYYAAEEIGRETDDRVERRRYRYRCQR